MAQSRGRGLKGILEVLDQILVEYNTRQTTDTSDKRPKIKDMNGENGVRV